MSELPEPQDHLDGTIYIPTYIPTEVAGFDFIFDELADGRVKIQFRDLHSSRIQYLSLSSHAVCKLREFLQTIPEPEYPDLER